MEIKHAIHLFNPVSNTIPTDSNMALYRSSNNKAEPQLWVDSIPLNVNINRNINGLFARSFPKIET
jgi:hypothetical protein